MSVPFVPLSIGEVIPGTVSLADLTSGNIGGTGVFDVLMSTVSKHILEEYNSNRLTGKEYSTVYLGAMAAVLQQSIAYLSIGKQVEKLNAEIGLTRQKIVSELVQTEDTITAGLGFNNSTSLEGLLAKQRDLLTGQISKTSAEISKNSAEISLLNQKTSTESAQTNDCGGGVLKKQMDLYKAQTDGFARDAEQKLAKIMVDSWAVRRTTDDATTVDGTGLTDGDIGDVIGKAKAGINA